MIKESKLDIIDTYIKKVETNATFQYNDITDKAVRIAREYGFTVGTLNMMLYDLQLSEDQINKLKAYIERG